MSTVRPSEEAAALAHLIGHADVTRVVVTRSDGAPVGLFFATDVPVTSSRPNCRPSGKPARSLGRDAGGLPDGWRAGEGAELGEHGAGLGRAGLLEFLVCLP